MSYNLFLSYVYASATQDFIDVAGFELFHCFVDVRRILEILLAPRPNLKPSDRSVIGSIAALVRSSLHARVRLSQWREIHRKPKLRNSGFHFFVEAFE